MSDEPFAYRASDELAEALREHRQADREFSESVAAFDQAHPGHELLWTSGAWTANKRAVGFRDGETEVPAGLSRAKSRVELIPKRGKAGDEWRTHLEWANTRPSLDKVFRRFDVPTHADGPMRSDLSHYVAGTQYGDAGADGVIVFNSFDLADQRKSGRDEPLELPHLTPIPLSEFYAIKERLESEQSAEAAS